MENKNINAYAIRMVRTEIGKMLRKDYESHKIHHGYNEHRVMEVGGVLCNAITIVQKDYLICEQVSIT